MFSPHKRGRGNRLNLPDFLPEILSLDGDWNELLEKLYSIFKRDFIDDRAYLESRYIEFDRRKIEDDKEEGFWHLITKGKEERLLDPRRAERLPWARKIVENHDHTSIKYWDYYEGLSTVRTYIWLFEFDYVLVLEKVKDYAILITGYYVEYSHQKRKLEKKYNKRI